MFLRGGGCGNHELGKDEGRESTRRDGNEPMASLYGKRPRLKGDHGNAKGNPEGGVGAKCEN